MKNNFIYCILLACIISLPNTALAQTAFQFNDRLSVITDSVYAKGSAWGNQFNEAYMQKKFSSVKPQRALFEKFLDENIELLKNMNDVNNSKELRMTVLNFLFFEKDMIRDAFLPLENLAANASDAVISAAISHLTNYAEKEVAELKKVRAAQEKYGRANGFEIEYQSE